MEINTYNELCSRIREISGRQRNSFEQENRVLLLTCLYPQAGPRDLCEFYPRHFGMTDSSPKREYDFIRVLRACKLNQPKEREKLAAAAYEAGTCLAGVLAGNSDAEKALQMVLSACPVHRQTARMILLTAEDHAGNAIDSQTHRALRRMNADFAQECLDALLELCLPQGDVQEADAREREIQRLRTDLTRAHTLLASLQEDFETRLEEYRAEELEQFFSRLNSEEYGYILDLLAAARRGITKMRLRKQPIPPALRPVQTLVRRMLEFTEDCGVETIAEPGTRIELRAADLAEYRYEGTPFTDRNEIKQAEIVSPGWKIAARGIVISFPAAVELETDETEPDKED